MRRKTINIFIGMLFCFCAKAQTEGYRYSAPLDTVRASGFYGIDVTSSMTPYLKPDLSDLRVVDAKGQWVPHIINTGNKEDLSSGMPLRFRITGLNAAGEFTDVTLESPELSSAFISYMELIIRNTNAERWCKLSGSDNKTDWYVVQDSVLLKPIPADSGKAAYSISFPSCNYKYFRLRLNNKQNDPVNILGVQTRIILQWQTFKMTEDNPAAAVSQTDSGKISYIKVTQSKAYHFDHIGFRVSGAKYFYRKVSLFIPQDSSATAQHPGPPDQTLYLSDKNVLEFNTALTNAKVFYIQIFNEDNPPLKADSIATSFHLRSLTAYLDSGAHYRLLLGNSAALMPQYDLEHMNRDSIKILSYINAGAITELPNAQAVSGKSATGKYIMWAAIIAALLVLLFFTLRMTKEIDKNKSNDRL